MEIINELMRNKKICPTCPSEFTQNGTRLTNNTDIVNEYKKMLMNIGKEITNKISNVSIKTINDYLINKNDHSMFLEPSDKEEIHSIFSVFIKVVN